MMKVIISIPNIFMLVPLKKNMCLQIITLKLKTSILLMYEHELSHFITSTNLLYDDNPVQSFLVLQLY